MKTVFYLKDKVTLTLSATPFASGGEGNLYRVQQPLAYANSVVKLYHEAKRTSSRREKLEYMIANPPTDYVQQDHFSVVWPQGLIQEKGDFAGVLMPFARGEKLEILCMPTIRKASQPQWGRFDRNQPDALALRLKICFNIAAAVYQLHETDRYVFVDLKTDNILIQPNGLISIVDMDSVEIIEGREVMFPATVNTPEYTPPEYYTQSVQPGKQPIFESWDLFSMSVIFYKLLMGIHPYAGSCAAPFDKLVSLHQKIEAGLFVHATSKKSFFSVVPKPHEAFARLDVTIRNLFTRSFEDGHNTPELRPDADEWCWTIAPTSRMVRTRKLPTEVLALQDLAYTKPLKLNDNALALPPKHAPIERPYFAPVKFSIKKAKLQSIVSNTVATAILAMVFGVISFNSWTVALVFGAMSTVFYARYRRLPEVRQMRLVTKEVERLRAERTEVAQRLDAVSPDFLKTSEKYKALVSHFEQQQRQHLIQEKKALEGHIKGLRQFLSKQEIAGRELLRVELKETEALQQRLFGDVYKKYRRLSKLPIAEQLAILEKEKNNRLLQLDMKLKLQLKNMNANKNQRLEAQKAAIKQRFADEENRIETEITEIKTNRQLAETQLIAYKKLKYDEFLRKQNIAENRALIFGEETPVTSAVCDYLQRNGIRSAADFAEVDADGWIRKTHEKDFINIPYLIPELAGALLEWKKSLEKTFFKLTEAEEKQLETKFQTKDLTQKSEQLRLQMFKALSEVTDDLEAEKMRLHTENAAEKTETLTHFDTLIQRITDNQTAYELQTETLKARFDAEHERLQRETETGFETLKTRIAEVNQQTAQANLRLFDKVTAFTEEPSFQTIRTRQFEIERYERELEAIETAYAVAKAKQDSFEGINFSAFMQMVLGMGLKD